MRRKSSTRRKTTLSKRTSAARPRRRVTRKKGMLSELFNPAMAQAGGKAIVSGALGGVGAGLLNKFFPEDTDPKMKGAYTIAAGFLTATLLKLPNVGSGMAGVGMYNLMSQSGFLSEGETSEVEYADEIEALPVVLDEDMTAYLQEDGMYLQEDGMYLQEDGLSYDVGYYEAGFGLDNM